jgi:hypothetical protein
VSFPGLPYGRTGRFTLSVWVRKLAVDGSAEAIAGALAAGTGGEGPEASRMSRAAKPSSPSKECHAPPSAPSPPANASEAPDDGGLNGSYEYLLAHANVQPLTPIARANSAFARNQARPGRAAARPYRLAPAPRCAPQLSALEGPSPPLRCPSPQITAYLPSRASPLYGVARGIVKDSNDGPGQLFLVPPRGPCGAA